uniref:Uncharacterized protein n=1 Tax=Romanomermis culicivorax TaxID=13658 RepID=A0A915JF67_ROMCU
MGSHGKMLNETTANISASKAIPLSLHQPTSRPTLKISVANTIGDHTMERHPKEVRIIPVAQGPIFMEVTLLPAQMILFRIPMYVFETFIDTSKTGPHYSPWSAATTPLSFPSMELMTGRKYMPF